MKTIYLISNETFSQSLKGKQVRLRSGSIMDIMDSIEEGDVRFVSNDVEMSRRVSNYLKLKIEMMDIDKIVEVGDEGFIVTPSINGVRDYDFVRILPENRLISRQALDIFNMHTNKANSRMLQ